MKRTLFTLFALLVIASMALTACGPKPFEVTEPTTITIWHQWSGDYLVAIQAAFDQYMVDHPLVTIVLEQPTDVQASLAVAIPAGEGPDIIGWANDQIGSNALSGNIVALDDYGINMRYLENNYEPAAVAGVVWQDRIWGLP
jgi:arabinogalactan oligomer/maltooligosaccharide transport system substrate-binding protein